MYYAHPESSPSSRFFLQSDKILFRFLGWGNEYYQVA
ncbi:BgTH12-02653 [Blumeria graminis f. sp. triticale]|uniref:BgTH12-02653 n=1 Tax=Blumeria graminis f. sp. triticale TaxID=1689686 RepID=A0A9W4DJM9_BLUGR|nr:BgTH12-02653 [Blumeria graminis f. sp. triticale]